jgi:hypothetical protein
MTCIFSMCIRAHTHVHLHRVKVIIGAPIETKDMDFEKRDYLAETLQKGALCVCVCGCCLKSKERLQKGAIYMCVCVWMLFE